MAYASVDDLTNWLHPEPVPPNARRLLETASEALDESLIGAVYDIGDPEVADVLRRACVRQVHWRMERDDETGANSDLQSMTTGQRSFTRRAPAAGTPGGPRVGHQAASVLRSAGLLVINPLVVG
ncbi:hypothetical protein [Streptomyces sp. H27-D2]|uniref:hypothetical protein n=1 Tax=Streptomyces sp. H27-D2 TaxID=3046304 RepID=UPI002DBA0E85|nr:hypothetical protein [Streptomyces sp. H27-D2]MEC4016093.1 hypothetical protein [Streptomyces sp. H27-D2]